MSERLIVAEPLTPEAFAPFGTVIDKDAVAPRPMNAGKARRFHDLAQVRVAGEDGHVVIGYVEAEPYGLPLAVSLVERHPLGAQAFLPLNAAPFLVVDRGGPGTNLEEFTFETPWSIRIRQAG